MIIYKPKTAPLKRQIAGLYQRLSGNDVRFPEIS